MSIRYQLEQLMQENGWSQKFVAKGIGKSVSVVSLYLNKCYSGDVMAVDELVKSFIETHQKKAIAPKTVDEFIDTHSSNKGLEVISMAHVDGEINVIYGDAGLGKTMIMKEYAKRHKNAILIEADPGYTAKALLEDLLVTLSIGRRGSLHDMCNLCIDALKESNRVLLIDEAELLPYKSLEVLRRIHDKSGIGIVLAGMPKLLVNLRGKRGEYAQLYSRVGFAFNLGNSLPLDEIKQISQLHLGNVDSDIYQLLFKKSNGNARRLFKLLRGVRRMSEINKQEVSKEMINSYAEMLISN